MSDHCGMAGSTEIGFSRRDKQAGNEVAEGRADADALEIGETDGAVLSPSRANRMREREDRGERGGSTIDAGDEADCAAVQIMA